MTPLQLQGIVAAGTLLLMLLGWAVTWGMLRGMVTRAIGEHDRRLNAIEADQAKQWQDIGATKSTLSNLRGSLGIVDAQGLSAHAGGD